MPVAIRLMRFGKKGQPSYRVVALDKRSKRDGAYIEKVGFYDPMTEPKQLDLNEERLAYWINNGAVVSDGLRKLLVSRTPKKPKRITKKAVKKVEPTKKAATPKKEKTAAPAKVETTEPQVAPVEPAATTEEAK